MLKRIFKIGSVPLVVILGKLVCFIFDALLGSYYGAGNISDAFILANTIPTVLFDGFATALIVCYVPTYSQLKYKSPERLDEYSSNVLNFSVIFGLIFAVLFSFFREPLMKLYAHGFDENAMGLLNSYTRVIIWSIPFISAFSIFKGYLQVNDAKAMTNISQVIVYIVLIGALMYSYPKDIMLPWAVLIGNIISFIVLLSMSILKGLKYKLILNFKKDYIRTILLMMIPIFLSSLVSEINSLADKFFASSYSAGIVTDMSYGYKLSFSIQGVVATSIMIILYPVLADSAAQNKLKLFSEQVNQCVKVVSWIAFPLVAGGVVLSQLIIQVVFGHGQFSQENVKVTSMVFALYLLGVIPMCLKQILDKACFAMKKTKYATYSSIISVSLNIILDCILQIKMGYLGLVLATDISIIVSTIIEYMFLHKLNKHIQWNNILKEFTRPLLNSIIMAVGVYSIQYCLENTWVFETISTKLAETVIIVACGIFIYIINAVFFCKKDLIKLRDMMR